MRLNKILSVFSIAVIILLVSCNKDNYDAPSSMLTGRVVYQKQPIGVRTPVNGGGGVQLELWQPGYALFQKIPVYVNSDGSFSASLFDGNYKLVMLRGSGPWVDNTDTINVQVNGATTIDFPVQPYYTITNSTFNKNGSNIDASAKINQVVATNPIEQATLFINNTQFVDANINIGKVEINGSSITDLSQPVSFSIAIPASVANKDYVFGRIGVKTTGVSEMIYSPVQRIQLK
jgi:Protein of unknown function (DUF3823) N-terminal domain/Domain of unknown function (DUF3823_C)